MVLNAGIMAHLIVDSPVSDCSLEGTKIHGKQTPNAAQIYTICL